MENSLQHHGIKGQRWGVRRFQNEDGSLTAAGKKRRNVQSSPESNDGTLSDKQKKAIKIGAAAVGTVLAVYGAHKFNKWVNSQNVKLAAHTGAEFANRFVEQTRPKSMTPGPIGQTRYVVGQRTAVDAGSKLSDYVSEKIASTKGVKKVSNAFNAKQITKGKKQVFDIIDYNKTVSEILNTHDVFKNGQSQFAKLVRDTINLGGGIPNEILKMMK